MPETGKMLVGLVGAAAISIAWDIYPQHNQFKLAKLSENPFAVMEHYHWGIISIIVARHTKTYAPYLDGLGAGLIVSEAGQEKPFAWDHPYFGASTIIGLSLMSILALSL